MTNNLDNITRETLSGKPVCCSRSEFTQHLANLTIVFDFKLSSVLVDFVQYSSSKFTKQRKTEWVTGNPSTRKLDSQVSNFV